MTRKVHKHQPTPEAFRAAYEWAENRDRYYGGDNATVALRNAYTMLCHFMPKGEQDGNSTLAHIMMTLLVEEHKQLHKKEAA